jgi:hypothetical protein
VTYFGDRVEARVYYACGCTSHHPDIHMKFLGQYVQECHAHGNHSIFDNPGRRLRNEIIRVIQKAKPYFYAWECPCGCAQDDTRQPEKCFGCKVPTLTMIRIGDGGGNPLYDVERIEEMRREAAERWEVLHDAWRDEKAALRAQWAEEHRSRYGTT